MSYTTCTILNKLKTDLTYIRNSIDKRNKLISDKDNEFLSKIKLSTIISSFKEIQENMNNLLQIRKKLTKLKIVEKKNLEHVKKLKKIYEKLVTQIDITESNKVSNKLLIEKSKNIDGIKLIFKDKDKPSIIISSHTSKINKALEQSLVLKNGKLTFDEDKYFDALKEIAEKEYEKHQNKSIYLTAIDKIKQITKAILDDIKNNKPPKYVLYITLAKDSNVEITNNNVLKYIENESKKNPKFKIMSRLLKTFPLLFDLKINKIKKDGNTLNKYAIEITLSEPMVQYIKMNSIKYMSLIANHKNYSHLDYLRYKDIDIDIATDEDIKEAKDFASKVQKYGYPRYMIRQMIANEIFNDFGFEINRIKTKNEEDAIKQYLGDLFLNAFIELTNKDFKSNEVISKDKTKEFLKSRYVVEHTQDKTSYIKLSKDKTIPIVINDELKTVENIKLYDLFNSSEDEKINDFRRLYISKFKSFITKIGLREKKRKVYSKDEHVEPTIYVKKQKSFSSIPTEAYEYLKQQSNKVFKANSAYTMILKSIVGSDETINGVPKILAIFGYKKIDKTLQEKYTPEQIENIYAKNIEIERYINEMLDNIDLFENGYKLQYNMMSGHRAMYQGALNPHETKFFRFLSTLENQQDIDVDLNNKKQFDLLKTAFAQAFGLDTDKKTKEEIYSELSNFVKIEPTGVEFIDKQLESIVNKINNNEELSIDDFKYLKSINDEITHTLLGIAELAKLKNHFDSGSKENFKTDLILESDGITSGIAIQRTMSLITLSALNGKSINEQLKDVKFKVAQAGIYLDNKISEHVIKLEKEYNHSKYKNEQNEDIYESVANSLNKQISDYVKNILDLIKRLSDDNDSIKRMKQSLKVFTSIIGSVERKHAKSAVTVTGYGANINNAFNKFFQSIFTDEIKSKYEKLYKSIKDKKLSEIIKELNEMNQKDINDKYIVYFVINKLLNDKTKSHFVKYVYDENEKAFTYKKIKDENELLNTELKYLKIDFEGFEDVINKEIFGIMKKLVKDDSFKQADLVDNIRTVFKSMKEIFVNVFDKNFNEIFSINDIQRALIDSQYDIFKMYADKKVKEKYGYNNFEDFLSNAPSIIIDEFLTDMYNNKTIYQTGTAYNEIPNAQIEYRKDKTQTVGDGKAFATLPSKKIIIGNDKSLRFESNSQSILDKYSFTTEPTPTKSALVIHSVDSAILSDASKATKDFDKAVLIFDATTVPINANAKANIEYALNRAFYINSAIAFNNVLSNAEPTQRLLNELKDEIDISDTIGSKNKIIDFADKLANYIRREINSKSDSIERAISANVMNQIFNKLDKVYNDKFKGYLSQLLDSDDLVEYNKVVDELSSAIEQESNIIKYITNYGTMFDKTKKSINEYIDKTYALIKQYQGDDSIDGAYSSIFDSKEKLKEFVLSRNTRFADLNKDFKKLLLDSISEKIIERSFKAFIDNKNQKKNMNTNEKGSMSFKAFRKKIDEITIDSKEELEKTIDELGDNIPEPTKMILKETVGSFIEWSKELKINKYITDVFNHGTANITTNTINIAGSKAVTSLQSVEEIYAHELVHLMTHTAIEYDKSLALKIRNLQEAVIDFIESEVKKGNINPETFFGLNNKEQSLMLFEYMKSDPEEFFTMAVTNKKLNEFIEQNKDKIIVKAKLLNELQDKRITSYLANIVIRIVNKVYSTFFRTNRALPDELQNILITSIDLTNRIKTGKESKTILDKAFNLTDDIVKKTGLYSNATSMLNSFDKKIKEIGYELTHSKKTDEILSKINHFTMKVNIDFQGLIHSLGSELFKHNIEYDDFILMYGSIKHKQETIRKEFETVMQKHIDNMFKEYNDSERKSLTFITLKSDFHALDLDELEQISKDGTYIQKRIKELEDEIRTNTDKDTAEAILNQAFGLAWFMQRGVAIVDNQMLNAQLINELAFDTLNKLSKPNKDLTLAIDKLTTYYALRNAKNSEHEKTFNKFFKDFNKVKEFYLLTENVIRKQERKMFDKDEMYKTVKGFIRPKKDSVFEYRLIYAKDFNKFKKLGWMKDIEYKTTKYDDNDEAIIRIKRINVEPNYTKGTFEVTDYSTVGESVINMSTFYDEFGNKISFGIFDIEKLRTNDGYLKGINTEYRAIKPLPYVSKIEEKDGSVKYKVLDYRYITPLEDILIKDDSYNIENVVSNMYAHNYAKINGKYINEKLIDLFNTAYKNADNQSDYIEISPYKNNEKYALLPVYTRQYLAKYYDSKLYVPKELVDDILGYKDFSVGQMISDNTSDAKRSLKYFIMLGERLWKDLIKIYKPILIIKDSGILFQNFLSNFTTVSTFMNPKETAKYFTYFWKMLTKYDEEKELLRQLELKNQIGIITQHEKIRLNVLKNSIESNPVYKMIKLGLIGSMIDEAEINEAENNAVNYFAEKGKRKLVKNKTVEKLIDDLYITDNTSISKKLRKILQYSDAVAKLSMYEYFRTNGMSDKEAIIRADEMFVNYNLNQHKLIKYASDTGLVMFTKYLLRTPKVLTWMVANNLVGSMKLLSINNVVDVPDIFESFDRPIGQILHYRMINSDNMIDLLINPVSRWKGLLSV